MTIPRKYTQPIYDEHYYRFKNQSESEIDDIWEEIEKLEKLIDDPEPDTKRRIF